MCGDLIDRAARHVEAVREEAMAAARHPNIDLLAHGRCHNCDAPLEKTRRFCDTYCMADWQRRCDAACREGRQ